MKEHDSSSSILPRIATGNTKSVSTTSSSITSSASIASGSSSTVRRKGATASAAAPKTTTTAATTSKTIKHHQNHHHKQQADANGITSSSSSVTSTRRRTTCWMMIQIAVGGVVLLRYGWNVLYLHSVWMSQVSSSSASSTVEGGFQQLLQGYYFPRLTTQQLSGAESEGIRSSSFVSLSNQGDTAGEDSEYENEEDDDDWEGNDLEYALFQQRRLKRQQQTRPPPPSLHTSAASETTIRAASSPSSLQSIFKTGSWRKSPTVLSIPLKPDWNALCQQAGFNETSRVVITGLLSQPPGQALTLLLGRKCHVKNILGVDALFPNIQKFRLQQMEDYKILKRSIDFLDLYVPNLAASSGEGDRQRTISTIRDFQPTHLIHLDTYLMDSLGGIAVSTTSSSSTSISSPLSARSGSGIVPSATEHLQTSLNFFFHVKLGLKYMNELLQSLVAVVKGNEDPSDVNVQTSTQPLPVLAYVVSSKTSNHPQSMMSYILAKSLHGIQITSRENLGMDNEKERTAAVPMIKLEVPDIFGPFAKPMDYRHRHHHPVEVLLANNHTTNNNDINSSSTSSSKITSYMYVELAAAAIMNALGQEKQQQSSSADTANHDQLSTFVARTEIVGSSSSTTTNAIEKEEEETDKYSTEAFYNNWEGETTEWLKTKQYDDLGNSQSKSSYIDTMGVPRTRFPCATKCGEGSEYCVPTVFDSVLPTTRKITKECDFILYITDFSTDFDEDDLPPQQEDEPDSEDEDSADDDDYEYAICRIAFVSRESSLAQELLEKEKGEEGEELSDDKIAELNGRIMYQNWKIVWLPVTEDEMSFTELAFLRIEPSDLFPKWVSKAMYTELKSFMKASNKRLLNTFKEMYRSRIGQRRKKEIRPGTSIWQWVTIPPQLQRKVIFFGKEPWKVPSSIDYYVERSKKIPRRQVEFYKDSMNLIMSNASRSPREIENALYEEFPLQWISTSMFIHDLASKWAQQFRCSWFNEHLHWRGGPDAEILSLAYILGKRRIEGIYGPRVDTDGDTSWMPLLYPDTNFDPYEPEARVVNAREQEMFIRVVERD